jgi:hypothetical protein
MGTTVSASGGELVMTARADRWAAASVRGSDGDGEVALSIDPLNPFDIRLNEPTEPSLLFRRVIDLDKAAKRPGRRVIPAKGGD